jgi:hypothetical protein
VDAAEAERRQALLLRLRRRVMGDGTVVFSESSIVYSGLTNVSGEVWHHAVISRDKGETWQNVVVAKVPLGESCVAAGCYPDFYAGQTSVVGDAPGTSSSRTRARLPTRGHSASTSRHRRTPAGRGAPVCPSR